MAEQGCILYAVSDLDGVWTDTPGAIVTYGQEVLGKNITVEDYHARGERIPELWGFDSRNPARLGEAREHWAHFCEAWMPRLVLMEGAERTADALKRAQETLGAIGVTLIVDVWTSRRHEYSEMTETWIRTHLGFMRAVQHSIDWMMPNAHLLSKADYLEKLPLRPFFYKEDEGKHIIPVALKLPSLRGVLFGESERNKKLIVPDNVLKLTTHAQLAEYIGQLAQEYEAAA